MKTWKKIIEKLVIEKLSQDESGIEQTPSGRYMIKKMKENKNFLKIFEDYKNNNK